MITKGIYKLGGTVHDSEISFNQDYLIQNLCLWCGPLIAIGFGLGFVLLGGFVPPPSPNLSANDIAEFYFSNASSIRSGMFICILAMTLIVPWGIGLALRLPSRRNTPALFFTQIAMVLTSSVVSVISCILWSLGTFRAGDISAEIIMTINDSAWFVFLLTWPSFSVWFFLLGISILQDRREKCAYPRWTAYLSFWVAALLIPAGLIPFFKAGPFAWNGLLAFYIVVIAFFVWLTVMSYHSITSIQQERKLAK